MRTYYELLGVPNSVPAEEIKRAFRKEIARYHPDKVQHLGPEFQEIAAVRAAELTEAYRILMDESARRRYDESLGESRAQASAGSASPSHGAPPQAEAPPTPEVRRQPSDTPPEDNRFHAARATTSDFVRRAALGRLREAVSAMTDGTESAPLGGMDAVFALKGKGGIFRKSEPTVRLGAKFVPQVDPQTIAEVWPLMTGISAAAGEMVCVLLLGSGLSPARELSVAVADQRRKARKTGPVVVPVDVRDWEALFPPEAPAAVRAVLQRLREGKT